MSAMMAVVPGASSRDTSSRKSEPMPSSVMSRHVPIHAPPASPATAPSGPPSRPTSAPANAPTAAPGMPMPTFSMSVISPPSVLCATRRPDPPAAGEPRHRAERPPQQPDERPRQCADRGPGHAHADLLHERDLAAFGLVCDAKPVKRDLAVVVQLLKRAHAFVRLPL